MPPAASHAQLNLTHTHDSCSLLLVSYLPHSPEPNLCGTPSSLPMHNLTHTHDSCSLLLVSYFPHSPEPNLCGTPSSLPTHNLTHIYDSCSLLPVSYLPHSLEPNPCATTLPTNLPTDLHNVITQQMVTPQAPPSEALSQYLYSPHLAYGTSNATKVEIKPRVHSVKSHASKIVECRSKKANVVQNDSNAV